MHVLLFGKAIACNGAHRCTKKRSTGQRITVGPIKIPAPTTRSGRVFALAGRFYASDAGHSPFCIQHLPLIALHRPPPPSLENLPTTIPTTQPTHAATKIPPQPPGRSHTRGRKWIGSPSSPVGSTAPPPRAKTPTRACAPCSSPSFSTLDSTTSSSTGPF